MHHGQKFKLNVFSAKIVWVCPRTREMQQHAKKCGLCGVHKAMMRVLVARVSIVNWMYKAQDSCMGT
jgi:hypothetical protein